LAKKKDHDIISNFKLDKQANGRTGREKSILPPFFPFFGVLLFTFDFYFVWLDHDDDNDDGVFAWVYLAHNHIPEGKKKRKKERSICFSSISYQQEKVYISRNVPSPVSTKQTAQDIPPTPYKKKTHTYLTMMHIQLTHSQPQEQHPTSYLILPVTQDPFLRSALQSPRPKEMFEAPLLQILEQATNPPPYSSISSSPSSSSSLSSSTTTTPASSSSSGGPYLSSFSSIASTESQSYFPSRSK